MSREVSLADLARAFEGVVPPVLATAAADGTPNVTYLSKVRAVDDHHVALSNQFFSKTARNLVENPRASLLVIDPADHEEYRLTLAFVGHERSGPVVDQLRADVDEIAAMSGTEDVFRLRGVDVHRVVAIEAVPRSGRLRPDRWEVPSAEDRMAALAELTARLNRCVDLDTLVGATVAGVAELLGYDHAVLFLVDDADDGAPARLVTIASHGYTAEGVGSEVVVGEGTVGMAAARRRPMRVGNLRQMTKYGDAARRSVGGTEIDLPRLPAVQSRLAVPAVALGQLVGVLAVESTRAAAFGPPDEAVLGVVAGLVAGAVEVERVGAGDDEAPRPLVAAPLEDGPEHRVRHFAVDGSTFLDGDYLIKGVPGRILWSLLHQYQREGRVEFTNRELRLDPSLELPDLRANLESRLILLKRRLDERAAPIRIERTGRGRFRVVVSGRFRLEAG